MSLRRMASADTDEWPENLQEAREMVYRACWHIRAHDTYNLTRCEAREILIEANAALVRELEIQAWAA